MHSVPLCEAPGHAWPRKFTVALSLIRRDSVYDRVGNSDFYRYRFGVAGIGNSDFSVTGLGMPERVYLLLGTLGFAGEASFSWAGWEPGSWN